MTDTGKVLRLMEEATARARGDGPSATSEHEAIDGAAREPSSRSEGVRFARDRLREAAGFSQAGTRLPDQVRLKPVKQAILTMIRPVTSHQVRFNEQLLAAVEGLVAETERLTRDLALQEQRATELQAAAVSTNDLSNSLKLLAVEVEALAEAVERFRADASGRLAAMGSELHTIRAKQDLIFRAARQALPAGYDVEQLSELTGELSTGYDELYEDFEDAFRGSRERIMAQQLEYVADVRSVPGRPQVVDVGCGRGEWLEVLRDAGIESYGIDVNNVVVERCRARGLDVRNADALVHLRQVPEGSVGVVTGFHVAEHLALDALVQLIDAAFVALKPGGLLVLETPNPTNITVGAAAFWLDPTHLKPLHPQFCEFLVLSRGFAEAELRYLHPDDVRLTTDDLTPADPVRVQGALDRINWAMFGPPDYAVLARKASSRSGHGDASPQGDPASPA